MTRIFGVDFSGSKTAGRKIWITSAHLNGEQLIVDDLRRAVDLPDGGRLREPALTALRQFIVSQPDAVFGLDFPFSLPRELIKYATWQEFLQQFATDYPTALEFKQICKAQSEGEQRRETDKQALTPFSPYNLWLFCQTFYGIRDVLAPLVEQDQVRILPMQQAAQGKPTLLEICPASTIKSLGLGQKYKGNKPPHKVMREQIRCGVVGANVLIPLDFAEQIVDDNEGDALDSVIAAMSVRDYLIGNYALPDEQYQHYQLEGFVYFSKPKD